MKYYMRKVFPVCLSILLAINVFIYSSLTVYAIPKRLLDGTWIDIPWSEAGEEIYHTIMFGLSQIGVLVTGADFEQWLKNSETYGDLFDENGRLAKNVSIDTQTGTVTYNKEIMIVLKNAVDEYAKTEQTKEENGGFYLFPTTDMHDVPIDKFTTREQYLTFLNIVNENGVLPVRVRYNYDIRFINPFSDPDHPILLVGNASDINRLETAPHMPVSCSFFCGTEWEFHGYDVKKFSDNNVIYTGINDSVDFNSGSIYDDRHSSSFIKWDWKNHGSLNEDFTLYSTTGERLRVFVSQVAAQNYSVGSRKIYFSENYYNYVPEDLTVAVDDLSKSVDDLQQVIDDLLDKISNDTSEKEIEELLRQILEELRKNPGTGSGESSGGGDLTVSVDLKETNSWLAKIYNRLGDVLDRMQEGFENVVEQLKKIKGWSIADTIIDGVDAVADWAQFIKDLLSDVTSGVATVSSTMTDAADLMKTKFPFCLPWDVAMLITFLAHEPQTPVFQLPIIIESFGIEEYIEVDMTRFSALSTLSRTLLTLIYCYGLVNLTFKVIPMVKEEN